MKSAARFTALTLALVAAMFINFGSRNASAQQTAAASATPTPTPKVVKVNRLTHGDGPVNGDQYMIPDGKGGVSTRVFEVSPDFGWQGVEILDMAADHGTFFTPAMVADLRTATPEQLQKYKAQVVQINGHGNGVKVRMRKCDKMVIWDTNLVLATNHYYHGSPDGNSWDYIELIGYAKNADGSETEILVARFSWRGASSMVVDYVNPWVQLYLGDRGAHHWLYQGNEVPLYAVPSTAPGGGWMYWPGLVGASFSMDMHSPFMNCVGFGFHAVNQVGINNTWAGILDVVEMLHETPGDPKTVAYGDGLYWGVKNGKFPIGEMCGETASCQPPPPVCEDTIPWIHPSQVQTCGGCDFPVWYNLHNSVRSGSDTAKIYLGRWNDPNANNRLQAFFAAVWYSREYAPGNCNDLRWAKILKGDLRCYGITDLPTGVQTVGDLLSATGQVATYGGTQERTNSLLDTWQKVAKRNVFK